MASNITNQYFTTVFDEFKKVDKLKLDAYISMASLRVPRTIWGDRTDFATALLAAHMLSTVGKQGSGGAGGAVTQQQVGDLSRSFATLFVPESGDSGLLTTNYGIQFVQLRKEIIVPAMSTRRPIFPGRCH